MGVYLKKKMERSNSGDWKMIFRSILCILDIGLMMYGRARWKEAEGNKKIFQYCTDPSGEILYLRALQGHSGRSLIDPSLQDNVIIPDGFFKYSYHVGCAINLHSIVNSGSIPGGQNLSNRQTVFFGPSTRNSFDPTERRFSKDYGADQPDENADADQIRTGTLLNSGHSIGLFTQREDIDIDFRVSGLPHAVVKQAENFRVRELVKKTESHPHWEAFQADMSQNNAYNPFSEESKVMIREMGNVELFELCETIPKVQCSECFLYWNQGVIYGTCGRLLVESESSKNFHKWRLDVLWIPHYGIRVERLRGARLGKTEAQKEHFLAHNAQKRCIKQNFDGLHDRFQRDSVYRDSQLKLGWTEEKCIEMDKLAQENYSYCPSSEEYERNKKNWYISLNKPGRNAPMKLRPDFLEAPTDMHRLHRESGEERPEPIPFHQYQWWHSSSSSSPSWWQWNEKLVELIKNCCSKIVQSRWQSAATDGR